MKDFVKIQDFRIRKSTIKKYRPHENKKLNLYYNSSRTKIELEVFPFKTKQERDSVLSELDNLFFK